ncbi:hypothetical protein [Nocardia mexicana]|uniref:RHIM domain-containing protein n=1 Tax=Nocardia mexicana TaxID=279262 RepID=A0A370GMA3_9NOCA|nr:hypothetical protein [Nocardia mexicana]RDI43544.1 hypothetical protein DFR68_12011 [Nocardia mexicana]
MDPFTVIATALVAGAAAGGQDAASAAVRDAYTAVRNRIRHGAAAPEEVTAAIEANESAPGADVSKIEAALTHAGLVDDGQLRAAAEELLSLLPGERVDQARARVDLRHAQGVVLGDHNTQHNTFR